MAKNRVHVKGDWRYEEAKAGAASIKPGMIVRRNSSGNLIIAGGTAGDFVPRQVALENALVGALVTTEYTNDTQMLYGIFAPGSEANVMLKSGQNVTNGDRLVFSGDGYLVREAGVASGTDIKQVVAEAMESINASAAAALCHVRFL